MLKLKFSDTVTKSGYDVYTMMMNAVLTVRRMEQGTSSCRGAGEGK